VRPGLALLVTVLACPAAAHDASIDVGTLITTSSSNNPRTGSFTVNAAGTWDVSEKVGLFGSFQFTRDLATRTADSASPGSDVFLLGLGAAWAPGERWLTMLSLTGSPPSTQLSATTVTTAAGATADVVVSSRAWTLGGLLLVSWASGGEGAVAPTFDGLAGVTRFEVFQRLRLGTDARSQALRATCEAGVGRRTRLCALVSGVSSPLTQVKLGAGATLTLLGDTDAGLEFAYYLYDRDPSEVGYFSLVSLGRLEVGAGVPVLPLQLSLRPSLTHRFGRLFILRVAYQFGLYPSGDGSNHAVTAKLTWRVTRDWRLWLSGTGQLDATRGVVTNPGGNLLLGALVEF
jgi:hypothetical protein